MTQDTAAVQAVDLVIRLGARFACGDPAYLKVHGKLRCRFCFQTHVGDHSRWRRELHNEDCVFATAHDLAPLLEAWKRGVPS